MTIYPGELLHSYILRILKSSGNLQKRSNLLDVMSSKGNWVAYPSISEEHRHLFSHFSRKRLLELIEYHTQAYRVRLTSAPSVFADLSEKVFWGISCNSKLDDIPVNTYKYKEQIRYCKQCFGEQLNLYGTPWFALVWLDAEKCQRHNTPLEKIGCKTCSDQPLLNKVISTFDGICTDCGNRIWNPTDFSHSYGEYCLNRRPHDVLTFAPCVFWEFIIFLKLKYKKLLKLKKKKEDFEIITKWKSGLIEQKVFDFKVEVLEIDLMAQPLTEKEELDLEMLENYPKVIFKSGIHKEFKFEQSVMLLSSVSQKLPKLIDEFWSNNVKKTSVRLRFPFNDCMKEITKAIKRDCKYCHMSYKECAASLTIVRERLDFPSNPAKPHWCESVMIQNAALF